MKYTKTLLTLVIMLFLVSGASADVPDSINYQGRMTDQTTGEPVPDGLYDLAFELFDGDPYGGGILLYPHVEVNVQVNPQIYPDYWSFASQLVGGI